MPDAPTPPQNPIGDAFARWRGRTPPVTQWTIMVLAGFWAITFLIPAAAFTNVAIHLIYELEIYRLVLASFVPSGLLGLALSGYWFSGMGADGPGGVTFNPVREGALVE